MFGLNIVVALSPAAQSALVSLPCWQFFSVYPSFFCLVRLAFSFGFFFSFSASLQEWKVTRLTFEYDPEPYGKERDGAIIKMAQEFGVETIIRNSHTLYNLDRFVAHTHTHTHTHSHTNTHSSIIFQCVQPGLVNTDICNSCFILAVCTIGVGISRYLTIRFDYDWEGYNEIIKWLFKFFLFLYMIYLFIFMIYLFSLCDYLVLLKQRICNDWSKDNKDNVTLPKQQKYREN